MSIVFWIINFAIIAWFSAFSATKYCSLSGFKSFFYVFLWSLLCGIIGGILGMIYMTHFAKIEGGGPQAGMGLIALIFAYGGIGFLINMTLTNIGAWGYCAFFVTDT